MKYRQLASVLSGVMLLCLVSACNSSSLSDGSAVEHTPKERVALKDSVLKPALSKALPANVVAPEMGTGMICTMQYDPVCGKRNTDVQCITSPCPTYEYKTFGNSCNAGASSASIAFKGQCGDLEGDSSFADKPVRMASSTAEPAGEALKVINSSVVDHVITLEVEYHQGCSNPQFDLIAKDTFLEGKPVQVSLGVYSLSVGDCEAPVRTKLSFDLMPLSEQYLRAYKKSTGTISLGELGSYSW